MKKLLVLFAIFFTVITYGQKSVNDYKYVIVPEKFEFAKEKNQYQLNALTKFLLEKYGFSTVMKSAEKPAELQSNNCLALEADVQNNSGLFVTKMVFQLKDCYGNVVYASEEGRSREKDYKKAYHEALRDAFTSLEDLNYTYSEDPIVAETPKKESVAVSSTTEATNAAEKEVEDVEQNEMDVEDATIGATKGKFYTNDKALYFLEENESGYGFYQKGMAEPFAMLIDSDGSDNFIYNSLTKQGMAYFADNGDLVVEIFDRQAGKSVKTTYKLQH
ncbi:MAG: hypothetical protein CMP12_13820 [Zunongwangia sp.]|uniref:Secreted protein n=2 Tax=Zunongwangia profunda TaxID=398743 RepID=D5BM55_ZUNPS|nr:hypothetical protein [Zunongwangia profunda]MAC65878.1 hypothetical protein [Flavobacteriaceae bacterium]MAO36955.1 hypothetical protein [Zunongwangia sp.]ADF54195.1 secreted protein [Zunongwangia profunda SM-A87]MAG86958.1 hypothetical protein [Flavobacteriaceae bacterium]MAS72247.1 hypothetical protein [Zunongwangia sp.]|tara:strand:+ start:278 stop:1102 length:825 start_codon:yes stop_codon:yes gene_type:complete